MEWTTIRSVNNSQQEGFEELVCQLARKENISNAKKFIRKGKPDAGVECFWILENEDEWAWQAKFFVSSLDEKHWRQVDESVKTILEKHPALKKYYTAFPLDPPDARLKEQHSIYDTAGELESS